MSKIVNLNKVRKLKSRATAERKAAENRVLFGRSKEQKQRDAAEAQLAHQRMDQLKRERPPEA